MKITREVWSAAVVVGLSKTFDDISPDEVRPLVENGTIEIYTIGGSWLAIEWRVDHLFVWAFQGSRAELVMGILTELARDRGLTEIRYRTKRPGMERLLARFAPRVTNQIERSIAL